jgi:hypothetical protein
MKFSALLLVAGLGLAALNPAEAKMKTPKSDNPKSTNANVKRASRKSRKGFKATKYKAPRVSKKPKRAKYGVTHTSKHT